MKLKTETGTKSKTDNKMEQSKSVLVTLPEEVVEFKFELMKIEDKNAYVYLFGKTQLKLFDSLEYQRRMRYWKQQALARRTEAEGEARPVKSIGRGEGPVFTYTRPVPWTNLDKFPELATTFDMESPFDAECVKTCLTVFKPRTIDEEGWVYVLQRQTDVEKLEKGEITSILLHKIGLTKKTCKQRVYQQARTNGEEYKIAASFRTSFHKYLEYAAHQMFKN